MTSNPQKVFFWGGLGFLIIIIIIIIIIIRGWGGGAGKQASYREILLRPTGLQREV